ncbi:MAG: hypothetical protein HY276_04530 [Ignavibacteriales bacterium]|nr:hypothetical protein [Ignavibacteriales bacterium]MBI3787506.1 hypothetical protein [Ignavibacteriales bacterium]
MKAYRLYADFKFFYFFLIIVAMLSFNCWPIKVIVVEVQKPVVIDSTKTVSVKVTNTVKVENGSTNTQRKTTSVVIKPNVNVGIEGPLHIVALNGEIEVWCPDPNGGYDKCKPARKYGPFLIGDVIINAKERIASTSGQDVQATIYTDN